jgi:hypothetical protein
MWCLEAQRHGGVQVHIAVTLSPNKLSNFKGQEFRIYWPLNMGPVGCPETSAMNYHSTLCNTSRERRSHILCGESLKSVILVFLFPFLNTCSVANINANSSHENYRVNTHSRWTQCVITANAWLPMKGRITTGRGHRSKWDCRGWKDVSIITPRIDTGMLMMSSNRDCFHHCHVVTRPSLACLRGFWVTFRYLIRLS